MKIFKYIKLNLMEAAGAGWGNITPEKEQL